jgi:hypothetical protein
MHSTVCTQFLDRHTWIALSNYWNSKHSPKAPQSRPKKGLNRRKSSMWRYSSQFTVSSGREVYLPSLWKNPSPSSGMHIAEMATPKVHYSLSVWKALPVVASHLPVWQISNGMTWDHSLEQSAFQISFQEKSEQVMYVRHEASIAATPSFKEKETAFTVSCSPPFIC